jgi:hypothetical protein
MENAIYWEGVQVGIEVCGNILWFTGTPSDVIEELSRN